MVSERDESATIERIRVCTIEAGEITAETDRLDDVELRAAGGSTVMWIDLTDPTETTLRMLEGTYDLHPLVVDEVLEPHRTSDVSYFDQTTHVVLQYPHLRDGTIRAVEIQAIIGHRCLITVHRPEALDFDAVLEHWRATPDEWRATSSSLLYAVFRTVVIAFQPVADYLDEALERLQQAAIAPRNVREPRRQLLYTLFHVTEQITDVDNMAEPAVEMMQSLEQNSEWFAHEKGTVYSRDVVDDATHLAHRMSLLGETAERLFDMVNSLITLRSTDVSNRLTIVATIFLPLTFITGYFGQNFRYMTDAVSGGWQLLLWGIVVPLASLAVILGLLRRFGAFR
jgi:magnesium transporter